MNTYFLTDIAILERVGAKIKARRIASRLTQKQLATDAGVSHSALCSLEAGKNTSLLTLVAILRALHSLDLLDSLIKDEEVSPLMYVQIQKDNKQPKRVRSPKIHSTNNQQSEW
jgi:transcriptional regulator with XRE-family HTH domain